MAVEARHLHLFPPQLIGNREIVNPIEGNANPYNTQMGYHHGVLPLPGPATTITAETLLPAYNSFVNDSVPPPKTAKKSDSGLTYNIPTTTTASFSRKRSREYSAAINSPFNSNLISIALFLNM
ncbi:hypothetical protein PanWU01x14_027960 [Parasponia andersonii]|uniref:Uncharacterized protein n=1 Tax=Parasponia andersonii TaxID=3476 RepID=A0A2P5DV76_PARAD|nr:hypothetical protein PanWU01x14_027960 [Parasponia andersonii]